MLPSSLITKCKFISLSLISSVCQFACLLCVCLLLNFKFHKVIIHVCVVKYIMTAIIMEDISNLFYLNHSIYQGVVLIYLIDKQEILSPENLNELPMVTQMAVQNCTWSQHFLIDPLLLLLYLCLECRITMSPF